MDISWNIQSISGFRFRLDRREVPPIDLRFMPHIPRTGFDQENIAGRTVSFDGVHDFFPFAAKAKLKVDPCPGSDSTAMVPPCRSTIFLQMANPMPVPANSSRLCNR